MKNSKLSTAFHEAGHAFADRKFGFKVKKASIKPDEETSGHVTFRMRLHLSDLAEASPTARRVAHLHEFVVCLLAGPAAEKRYLGSGCRCHGASGDYRAAGEILLRLHAENETPHVFRYLQARAKNLVENPTNWFVIRHLARELTKRESMNGQEVEASIRQGFKCLTAHISHRPIAQGCLAIQS